MATKALSLAEVKPEWSQVKETTIYGPYNEALQYRLLLGLWSNEALKNEFTSNPKAVLEREAHLKLPGHMQVQVVEDTPDRFHFILPRTPAKKEFNYRYQQIADWWMLAHYLGVRQLREGKELASVDSFRKALHVMIIGHVWFYPSFKRAMIEDAKAALEAETGARFQSDLTAIAPEDSDKVTTSPSPSIRTRSNCSTIRGKEATRNTRLSVPTLNDLFLVRTRRKTE